MEMTRHESVYSVMRDLASFNHRLSLAKEFSLKLSRTVHVNEHRGEEE